MYDIVRQWHREDYEAIVGAGCFHYSEPLAEDPTSPTARKLEMIKTAKRNFRMSNDIWDRVDARAASAGCTPTDIVREALERHLRDAHILDESRRRHLRITEYMQLALDVIVRKEHPEMRDRLIEEADRRMKMHHGG